MAALVFVDTDILIDVARGAEEAKACLGAIQKQGPVALSVITQMELMIGCRNKNELSVLQRFLSNFVVIDLGDHFAIGG